LHNLKTLLAAAAVLSLSTTPVLANPAAALSPVRAATSPKKANTLAPAVLIGVLATVAIIGGAVVLSNNDDEPDSN